MRGSCTTEDEPGTASYCMLVQPEESLDLFAVVRQPGRNESCSRNTAPHGAFGVPALEVVDPGLAVLELTVEQVVGRDEHRVSDRDDGLLVPAVHREQPRRNDLAAPARPQGDGEGSTVSLILGLAGELNAR